MLRIGRILLVLAIAIVLLPSVLYAQVYDDEFDPESKLNTNIAFPITVPVSSTSDFTHFGTGMIVGAGYNFNRHHAFVGEFMWNWLYPTEESLQPLRPATAKGDLNGHSNLFAFTANYKYELRGPRIGTYFIGGVGFYYRNASRTESVSPPPGTACTPVWQWWGFGCSAGTVNMDQTNSSFPSSTIGGNAGMGITFSLPDQPRYRMYVEARYHYAPGTFHLRLIPVTVGIRF